jgi:WhiB family transcriptional regulator, redox-sensing transcriptional regulator
VTPIASTPTAASIATNPPAEVGVWATSNPKQTVIPTCSISQTNTQTTTPPTTQPTGQSSSQGTGQPHLSIVDATWNNLSWRQHASCANLDTNVFFPVGLTGNAIEQTNLAKTICNDCPVSKQCLEFALRTLQDYGVWGGRTEDERRAIRRARRAAARKAAAAAAASARSEQSRRDDNWQVAGS